MLESHISRLTLARYYIETELHHIFPAASHGYAAAIQATLDSLPEHDIWRLLEALSYTYRINGIFGAVTNTGYDWHLLSLPIADLRLAPINPTVDRVLFSQPIQGDPLRFAAYLQGYFEEHQNGDPAGLFEFKPANPTVLHERLFIVQSKTGRLTVIDGSHRLIVMAIGGVRTVTAYAGIRNGKASKRMAGDSIFETMKALYRKASSPADEAAVLAVTKLLMKDSSDGKQAVLNYWVRHGLTQKEIAAARILLLGRQRPTKK